MSSSALIHQVAVDAISLLETKAWREDVLRRHRHGERIMTVYGRPVNDEVLITAAFRADTGGIELTRARVSKEHGYHELTSEIPAMHCFERELHEQTGVRIAAHPWLKPIRYEHAEQSAMNAYPFYKIEGKEVHEVAVGPIHAGIIEPGSFRFMCHGEQVHHLEIQLGYQHRGVEALLLRGDPTRLTPWVETIAGDTSVAHAWAYCAAIENLADCHLELDAEIARAVVLELERVAMHLAGLAGLAADIGFLQGATTYGRLRTTAINTTMRLCGSRFGRGALRPGGIGIELGPDLRREVGENLALLQTDIAIINECFLAAQTVQDRLQGVGTLSADDARRLGIVGMAARASGVNIDARLDARWGAYSAITMGPQVLGEGDCWARGRIRIAEIDASLRWIGTALDRCGGWRRQRRQVGPLDAKRLTLAVVEGWRGEVVHALETDEEGRLAHYKVQDPSLRNWMGLALAVRRNEISDFPICNKSFDLSYCGNDL